MSDLRTSFEKEILKENPLATQKEIQSEWELFIKEYNEYHVEQARQTARRATERWGSNS
jgi:hypothetical protein